MRCHEPMTRYSKSSLKNNIHCDVHRVAEKSKSVLFLWSYLNRFATFAFDAKTAEKAEANAATHLT